MHYSDISCRFLLPTPFDSSPFCCFLFCVFPCCICSGNKCGDRICTKLLKHILIKYILHYSGISCRFLLPTPFDSSLFCCFLFCVFPCCICSGNRCGDRICTKLLKHILIKQFLNSSEIFCTFLLPTPFDSSLFYCFLFCVFPCSIFSGNRCGDRICTKLLKHILIKHILHYSGICCRFLLRTPFDSSLFCCFLFCVFPFCICSGNRCVDRICTKLLKHSNKTHFALFWHFL